MVERFNGRIAKIAKTTRFHSGKELEQTLLQLELPRFSGQFHIWGLTPSFVPGMLSLEVDWRQIAQR